MNINPEIFNTVNSDIPFLLENEYSIPWSMSRTEKYAFIKLLETIKPDNAIEIGCYKGGSLQVLQKYCKKVYSIDVDSSLRDERTNQFSNVDFLIGKSKDIVPNIINQLNNNNKKLDLVLIDGDHSYKGVKNDFNLFLNYIPKKPLYIIFHDSFNPICRKGIKAANFTKSDHIHFIDLDFISGTFPSDHKKEMWGGLALAILLPEKRKKEFIIHESQKRLYKAAFKNSSHFWKETIKNLIGYYKKQ
ncbi:class I SAM-dependent methyltransferase [Pseudofulvibacter geojedonensis]|uniref:Class I SAM-dependent methyltransferase n=1 Tax=Pseudofulvibacter geojedonensis TaxID=1123758 RepID=A0ABW3I1A0_9FLAO